VFIAASRAQATVDCLTATQEGASVYPLCQLSGQNGVRSTGILAPIRELLQNAVDAVRARRAHQGRPSDWGKIRIIIESQDSATPEVWLHVDDQGTGMSERVVTGPLIDFGKSFWSSTLMDDEFPGLRSQAPKLVGKFGIGFFLYSYWVTLYA
jgi:HSP90 family molecular chaperone